jgi:hypothetical protein
MGATIIEPRPAPIPFAAIDAYAQRYGVEGHAFDVLLQLVTALDRAYREWETEQAQERAQQRKG